MNTSEFDNEQISKETSIQGNEIWRDVIDFGGAFAEAYQVNSRGELWSKDRFVTYKNGRRVFYEGRCLETRRDYCRVFLCYNGKKVREFVYHLIANAFPEICGTWFPGAEIDHLNGNPSDNRPENLRWCTHTENINNPISTERRDKAMKEVRKRPEVKDKMSMAQRNRSDQSKPVLQFANDGTFISEYPSAGEAARMTGINLSTIASVCRGRKYNKSAGGFIWKYKEAS